MLVLDKQQVGSGSGPARIWAAAFEEEEPAASVCLLMALIPTRSSSLSLTTTRVAAATNAGLGFPPAPPSTTASRDGGRGPRGPAVYAQGVHLLELDIIWDRGPAAEGVMAERSRPGNGEVQQTWLDAMTPDLTNAMTPDPRGPDAFKLRGSQTFTIKLQFLWGHKKNI